MSQMPENELVAEHAPGATQISPEIDKIAKALCDVQAALKLAPQDRENPFYRSKYTTLGATWDLVRGSLAKAGLALTQLPSAAGETVSVETILMHTSGQYIRSTITMLLRPEFARDGKLLKPSPQQIGSAITYARRYAMSAILGIATDQDDDGNAASGKPEPPATPPASNRRSAHTGERLDTPEAVQRHKEATSKPAKSKAKAVTSATAFNARLYDACEEAEITVEQLNADLIEAGILTGKMTVDNLAEPIVTQLLDGTHKKTGEKNWDRVVARIKQKG